MNVEEMREVLSRVKVPEFEFRIHEEQLFRDIPYRSEESPEVLKLYLQGHYIEKDVHSGVDEPQSTRKYIVSVHTTDSELVQTAFLCYLQSLEHQARESFVYRPQGQEQFKRVYGPHYDVDRLWDIAGKDANLDYRRTKPESREAGPFRRRPDLDCALHKWASMGGGCPTCAMHHTYTV